MEEENDRRRGALIIIYLGLHTHRKKDNYGIGHGLTVKSKD